MHKHYETTFILSPALSESQMKEILTQFTQLIEKQEGKLVDQEKWGIRALAYPIKKQTKGYYIVNQVELPTASVQNLKTFYQREEHILRHLTVQLDRHGIAYLAEEKKKRKHVASQPAAEKSPTKQEKV